MRNSGGKVRPGRGPADNEPFFDISANFVAIFDRQNNLLRQTSISRTYPLERRVAIVEPGMERMLRSKSDYSSKSIYKGSILAGI
jgi:hypothetical protein